MELEGRGIFFSELSKYNVVDFNNKKMGYVGDMLIDKQTLATKGLIVYGSFIEEKLEAVGLKEDVDPIIPIEMVDYSRFHEKVVAASKAKHQLPATSNDYKPPDDSFLFSNLKQYHILDQQGESVGHLIDICFHSDGKKTLVLKSGKHFHVGNAQRFIQAREVLVPGKYISQIHDNKIELNVSRDELAFHKEFGLHRFIDKDIKALDKGLDEIGSRFHYNVFAVPIERAIDKMHKREEKLSGVKNSLKIVQYDAHNESQTNDLVSIFNDIALTSPDPYEELTPDLAKAHFGNMTFLVYLGPKIIGYNILASEDTPEGKTGSIAGIGLHHNQRGKGYASAILSDAIHYFEEKGGYTKLEADILVSNDASSKLFGKFGFKQVSDFYLS